MQFAVNTADALDRRNLFASNGLDGRPAGSDRRTIQVNCAGSALCNAATELGAVKSRLFPNHPK
jgi:hypothetical protein